MKSKLISSDLENLSSSVEETTKANNLSDMGKSVRSVSENKKDAPNHVLKRKRSTAKEPTRSTLNKLQAALSKDKNRNSNKTVNKQTRKTLKRQKVDAEENEDSNVSSSKDLSREHIVQCITAIFHLTQEQLKSKNALFEGESQPIFMQVTCIRVPKTPRRQVRILLPHSLASPDDDVALFVCDLQRGRRKDYEPTVEHYQQLLDKHNCTSIKTIIPLNQVKTEYDQYELKRKLIASYDHFLVDGRIAGHLSHLLGKEFYKKRKLPTSIRIQSKDLKHEIEHALKKTHMQLHSFGDTHVIQIGHTSMTKDEILENILTTCEFLSKNYPGGWDNIRCLRIKTTASLALPIYMTLKNKNDVMVPVTAPKRPKAYREVTGELSTLPGRAKITVTPEGEVIVKKKPKLKGNEKKEDKVIN